MPRDQEEPNRVLGMPVRARPRDRPGREPRDPQGGEPQRVLGFPVDWLDPASRTLAAVLGRQVRAGQRWVRRRLGR